MRLEFRLVKNNLLGLGMGRVGQFPLAGTLSDLPTNVTVDWIPSQDDFGTTWIGQADIQHTLVVIIKKSKPGKPVIRPDRIYQCSGVLFASFESDPKYIIILGVTHKTGVKGLTM